MLLLDDDDDKEEQEEPPLISLHTNQPTIVINIVTTWRTITTRRIIHEKSTKEISVDETERDQIDLLLVVRTN